MTNKKEKSSMGSLLRQAITTLIGMVFLAACAYGAMNLFKKKALPKPQGRQSVPSVFVQTVKNENAPIALTASGNLLAKNRVEIYSEVAGVFEYSNGDFKAGSYYKGGATLLRINSDELQASLRSQKSALYNQIVQLLPDLKFDYPAAAPNWEAYIANFDNSKALQKLPESTSEKERLFIAGRNIQTTWYNVKNLEERAAKYVIRAPFNGTLTQALVTKGALVRAGQKLGEFIDPNIYELEVAVNTSYANLLQKGKTVQLHDLEKTQTWQGKVVRINNQIDPNTQTIKVFIQVQGKGLREGMYLEADLQAREVTNTYEVSRKLLVNSNQLYVLRDSTLELATIEAVHFKDKTVIIRGLKDGTKLLAKTVPGAYAGMVVKVME